MASRLARCIHRPAEDWVELIAGALTRRPRPGQQARVISSSSSVSSRISVLSVLSTAVFTEASGREASEAPQLLPTGPSLPRSLSAILPSRRQKMLRVPSATLSPTSRQVL